MNVKDNLRKLREARGLSIRALAHKAGVGYVSVFRIEAGQQDPTLSMLVRLAKALKVTVADLIGEGKLSARKARSRTLTLSRRRA